MKNSTDLSSREDSKLITLHLTRTHFEVPCSTLSLQALPEINTNVRELIEEQSNKTPDKPAVIFGNSCLSFSELNQRSSDLAHYLRFIGVETQSLIGVHLDRDPNLIIAILAIWKLNTVYLPLDPNFPLTRLKFMLEDANATIILTTKNLCNSLNGVTQKILLLDEILTSNSYTDFLRTLKKPLSLTEPQNLAYVIYTSGSTGTPKGVMIEHKSFANVLLARMIHYQQPINLLILSSIGFDITVMSIADALISGGTIVLEKQQVAVNFEEIVSSINAFSINFLLCVPSLYSGILQKAKDCLSIKSIVLGGESIAPFLVDLHAKKLPQASLFNEYGPTECTICTTVAKIYDAETKTINKITIGKPLANTQVYILDETLHEVPVGEKGEIFIGGIGLARGYLNNEELTKEKFIFLTLGSESIRVYRTGDLGRFLPSGDIEFLGRIDHQVKIRGYRIELGEIECAISQFSLIKDAIVTVQDDPDGSKRLIAYFSALTQVSIIELKDHLTKVLPKHMVPNAYMQIEQFSLTPNGKIDRKALPKFSEAKESYDTKNYSELQKLILSCWQKTLHVSDVSIHDNFFDIGGDSLLIVVLQTLLEDSIGSKVPIVDLFQYPTIFQLAQYLERKNNETVRSSISSQNSDSADKRKNAFQRFKQTHLDKRKP